MANIELAAIALGIIIIVTRFPAILWPRRFASFWLKKVSRESFVKTMAPLSILVGLLFIYFIWSEITLLQLLVAGISFAMIAIGTMNYIAPQVPATILKTLSGKPTLLRALAAIAVLIGLYLILLALGVVAF